MVTATGRNRGVWLTAPHPSGSAVAREGAAPSAHLFEDPAPEAGRPERRLIVPRSDSETPCGVETFARRLAEAAGARADGPVLGRHPAPRGPGALVINLPVVAWKRALLAPVRVAVLARVRGLSVVVVLHEWDDLDPRRRASYLPLVLAAHSLLFSCAAVERQLSRSWTGRLATRRRGVVPVPPNVSPPGATAGGRHAARLAAERAAGRLVLGYFGSIYPKKNPTAVLDVAAELKRRGHDPVVVFAGSFVRGSDTVERDFARRVTALGLDGAVTVTGYIPSEAELYGLFAEVDVFVYRFAEGLTPRRASVFACLLSGRPVVVNAPRDPDEFALHPSYRALLGSGALRLVGTEAGPRDLADAVLAARGPGVPVRVDVAQAWAEALAAVDAAAAPERRRTPGHA